MPKTPKRAAYRSNGGDRSDPLKSQESLQSFDELTTLNRQLGEALERERRISSDLQNILHSMDVATLFLDVELNIRFFTPATKALFAVLPGDVGRPLSDLRSLADDNALAEDADAVLRNHQPIEREIATGDRIWCRRMLPYISESSGVEGLVVTFHDITARKRATEEVEATKRVAERANAAKSRFLAIASHDLRQPLQSLALLQGLLAKTVKGEKPQQLVAKLEHTLAAMAGMLNTLLDINQIEAGNVRATDSDFRIGDLLAKLHAEFSYQAQSKGLSIHLVASSVIVRSDPDLLEQLLRNLVSNALKYTKRGKVLIGCRRRGGGVRIEIWDTGIGIAEAQRQAIFDEYHQIDNGARERSRGLGLGLSIVERLAEILGHPVLVDSTPEKGSVFSIEIDRAPVDQSARTARASLPVPHKPEPQTRTSGTVLVAEDDPDIRELLGEFLQGLGHHVTTVSDGVAALASVARGGIRPDLLLADFNLPGGMDGLALAAALRLLCNTQLPVIVLTGDISTETLRAIAAQDCAQLNKPVVLDDLDGRIAAILATTAQAPVHITSGPTVPVIYVIDDDSHVRAAIRAVLEDEGMKVEDFADAETFLKAPQPAGLACLLIDAYLPEMSGLELLDTLGRTGHRLPAIMITGHSDVAIAVRAMKTGATDFIEKPVGRGELLEAIERALDHFRDTGAVTARHDAAADAVIVLTKRQREIMDMVLAGHPSKNIATDLGISQRTVENHRAAVMKRTGTKSLPALARLAFDACGCFRLDRCPLHGQPGSADTVA